MSNSGEIEGRSKSQLMAFLLDDLDDGGAGVDALLALLDDGDEDAAAHRETLNAFLDDSGSTASTVSSSSSSSSESVEDLSSLLFLDALVADDCAGDDALPLGSELSSFDCLVQEPPEAAEQEPPPPRAPESTLLRHKSARKSGAKAARSWDPNKARKEQRAELLHLRQQADALERQLSALQAAKQQHLQQPSPAEWLAGAAPSQCQLGVDPSSMRSSSLSLSHPHSVGKWQHAAMSERHARLRAEAENAQMKVVLENQLLIARSLETILQATASTQAVLGPLQQRQPSSLGSSLDPTLSGLFAGVDASYAEVDAVFAANGLALGMERPRLRSQVHYTGARGVELEITANQRLPFDARATSAAVWHYFTVSKQNVPYRVYSEAPAAIAETTHDTHVERFNWRLQLHGTSADFEVTQVLRRFEEPDRVVVVWRSVATPVEFAGEPMAGIEFLEKGYNVIKKPKSRSDAANESLLQSCYIITPAIVEARDGEQEEKQRRPPRVGAVTDFILHATAAGLSRSHRMIESVLRRGYAEQESVEYTGESKFELLHDHVTV